MTDWNADFDALVQETMAVAKNNRVDPPSPRTIVEPSAPRTTVEPSRLPPASLPKSERDEIRDRVSNFKAHQERFTREREGYAASQIKRMQERSWRGSMGKAEAEEGSIIGQDGGAIRSGMKPA
jgi:hypothetical protein